MHSIHNTIIYYEKLKICSQIKNRKDKLMTLTSNYYSHVPRLIYNSNNILLLSSDTQLIKQIISGFQYQNEISKFNLTGICDLAED